jgi:glycosyltransferase involved in cell wall biosynthesis
VRDRFEILICDDSQSDATTYVVRKYKEKLPIKYWRRTESRGVDSALLSLLDVARGEYVWWFGDDILNPGAVDHLTQFIESTPGLAFIWLNSEDETDSASKTFGMEKTRMFCSRNELLNYDIGLLGFITATIFKRILAADAIKGAERYVGTSFVSLYIILSVLKGEGSCAMVGESCFRSKPKPSGEIRWYNQIEVFGINLYIICKANGGAFSQIALNKALTRNMVRVLKSMLVERALGYKTGFANTDLKMRKLVKIYWSNPRFWFYFIPLALPRCVLGSLYRIFTTFKRAAT